MINLKFRSKSNGVPILSKDEMDSMAELILNDYDQKLLSEPSAIDIESFAEFYVGLQMDYQDLSHNGSILGMIVFNECRVPVYDASKQEAKYIPVSEATVLIDNSLLEEDKKRRGRFTLGHETSHWLLHRKKYWVNPDQLSILGTESAEPVIKCKTVNVESMAQKNGLSSDDDWIEWQADYMSSAFLMPKSNVSTLVKESFNRLGIKKGYYEKGEDDDLDIWVENFLPPMIAETFDVSLQAATIRLKSLKLVREKPLIQQLKFC